MATKSLKEKWLSKVQSAREKGEKGAGRSSTVTQLAQADKPKEIPVPNFCTNFTDVFSEKTYNILPPHQSFDHTIKLKDSFVPKIAKVYPLNPAEKEACKAFIDEHLKTGQIVPSKSPQATPFFFVPKKDGTLCLCQDYRYLNSHTI